MVAIDGHLPFLKILGKRDSTRKIRKMTTKIANIPCHINTNDCLNTSIMLSPPYTNIPGTSPRMTPPAITEAICPATFAPTACINR